METFEDLQSVAAAALQRLVASQPVAYGHDVLPETSEEYLRRSVTELRRSAGTDGQDAEAADLVRVVAACDDLEVVSANNLAGGEFAFYALCYSQPNGEVVGFIRAVNPAKVMKKAAFVGRFTGTLRRVQKPDLVLDAEVDLVLTHGELAILRRSAYDRLFADLDELAAAVPANVATLVTAMPSLLLAEASVEVLRGLGTQLSSVARRLERLPATDGLNSLTPENLRAVLRRHGEDPDLWFNDENQVLLDRDRAKEFLDVVEGRWWTADFQQERRRADRFRPR